MRNVCEIEYLENLDSSELVEEHMSNKSENKDEENCTTDDYNLNSDTETKKNFEVNQLKILHIAMLQ